MLCATYNVHAARVDAHTCTCRCMDRMAGNFHGTLIFVIFVVDVAVTKIPLMKKFSASAVIRSR